MRVSKWASPVATGENYDLDAALSRVVEACGEDAFTLPEGRRELTRDDPLLFAVVYLPHLLKAPDGAITFSDAHLEFCRHALTWQTGAGLREHRHAYIAPRGVGKSSWWYVLIPLWAGAHQHPAGEFIAAFSSSGRQAQDHLAAVRMELKRNKLLQTDYPELCEPARLDARTTVADTQHMYHAASGFSFSARGLDAEVLGLVDPKNRRPTTIILDDPEPSGEVYSAYQRDKRLRTIIDAVLAMNEAAHVVWVGTTTMADGLAHQLVKHAAGQEQPWVVDTGFRVHHFDPLPHNPDGTRRSIWPAKWPRDWLEELEARGSVDFHKNFRNRPMPSDGTWWRPQDIHTPQQGRVALRMVLAVDPAVTTKSKSDFTGFAVVSQGAPPGETRQPVGQVVAQTATGAAMNAAIVSDAMRGERQAQTVVHYATGRRIAHGEPMRAFVSALLADYPEVSEIVVETNQGGELMEQAFAGLGVRVTTEHTSSSKEVRFAGLLQRCQTGRVAFDTAGTIEFADQALAYPGVTNDDVIDAVCQGVDAIDEPAGILGAGGFTYAHR